MRAGATTRWGASFAGAANFVFRPADDQFVYRIEAPGRRGLDPAQRGRRFPAHRAVFLTRALALNPFAAGFLLSCR